MRIIAGQFRGRQLLSPHGATTRPITDRVKQSLFDIITPLLDGSRIYDCFCGTGSMGLEALSRGAAEVTFFEADRSALAILNRNIDTLKVAARTRIVATDLLQWFATRTPRPPTSPGIDLAFFDPPYRFVTERPVQLRELLKRLAVEDLVPGGTIVFRHDARDVLEVAELARYDSRQYGNMMLEFLRLKDR